MTAKKKSSPPLIPKNKSLAFQVEQALFARFEEHTLPSMWEHRKQQIIETLKARNAYLDPARSVEDNVELLLQQLRGRSSIVGSAAYNWLQDL